MPTIIQLNKVHNTSSANGADNDLIDSKDRDIRSRRAMFLKWLRKTHGWIGLWGAAISLLFGVTGILLSHRTVLKIPAAQVQETMLQIPLPSPAPANAKAMASWLQQELMVDRRLARAQRTGQTCGMGRQDPKTARALVSYI